MPTARDKMLEASRLDSGVAARTHFLSVIDADTVLGAGFELFINSDIEAELTSSIEANIESTIEIFEDDTLSFEINNDMENEI